MVEKIETANIYLWDKHIASISWDSKEHIAFFEYTKKFQNSNIKIAPLTMPLSSKIYSFKGLNYESFKGLPALLADSLPDKFGNAIIDQWLVKQGRAKESFSPIERLCYIGTRGMGALEFKPSLGLKYASKSQPIHFNKLIDLANEILKERENLNESFLDEKNDTETLKEIIKVGTSAGGARAKAIIAWNPKTEEVRSGQCALPDGFEHWLIKFAGVSNKDKEDVDLPEYGKIEYVYYLLAKEAGIKMMECRLLKKAGLEHFMTKRFDRINNEKLHMQSLCAMKHFDFNYAGAYSYEQALQVILELGLGHDTLIELFRRMVFNVVARNQDDHTKNISFLMDKTGTWELAPAFDLMFNYNPNGDWTSKHQMTINGKQDDIKLDDLLSVAKLYNIKKGEKIIIEVMNAVKKWEIFAKYANISEEKINFIKKLHIFYKV